MRKDRWVAQSFVVALLLGGVDDAVAQVRQEWVARYNGPANSTDAAYVIAIGAEGNVYVTGHSLGVGTGDDYATAKYNADGTQLWVARYNGPGNSDDFANAIALDAAGNAYVTGGSVGIGTGRDYATIKYDADGNELWVARYNGPGNSDDFGNAIALDAAGNVYVTGVSAGAGTGDDYATIKYDADGNELWVARYNGPGNSNDFASAIALDSSGTVYVTGSSMGLGSGFDYATVKYDAGGSQLWAARYNGPANGFDQANAIAMDAAGDVYVTGDSVGVGTGHDYATVKYDAGGNQLWVARYNGPANSDDFASAIGLDGSGNVYVTGGSTGVDTGFEYATTKYDGAGNLLWASRYNDPANNDDAATAMALDAAGNVYVTGYSCGSGPYPDCYDYATVKYNTDGNELWVARYNGSANRDDGATAIALDAAGNVYVTGYSVGVDTGYDFATVMYTQKQPR